MEKSTYYADRSLHPRLVAYYFRELGQVERVLDLGCGTGEMGRHKPDASIDVHGIEHDRKALAQAKEAEQVVQCDLRRGQLPYSNQSFDGIIAKDILEHLPEPWNICREMHRVLKPGRHVYASVPMARPCVVWNDYTHVRGYTKKAIGDMFQNSGFDVCKMERWGGIPGFGRMNLVPWIPTVLEIPGFNYFYGRSWGD